ncbi:amino acid adenylation domain-containing protein [Candidatus Nitrospira bockiana]
MPTPPDTFVDLLHARAARTPDRRAFTFLADGEHDARHLSYGELDRQAREIAARLQAIGTAGDRAVLLYPPGLEYVAAFFGCLYAGVLPVPAYPPQRRRTLPRLKAVLADARPTVALMTSQIQAGLERLSRQDEEFRRIQPPRQLVTDGVLDEAADRWVKPPLGGGSLAFLQYTSGSTGVPKGVMVSHGNLLHNQRQIELAFGHTEETVVVGWLPLYHDMGLIGNLLQPVYLGVPCIMMAPHHFLQKPLRWLDAISRYRATTSGGPNFAYELCVREIPPERRLALDLASWAVAFNGAEPVRAATLERFSETFGPCGFRRAAFYPCYGLAEATLFVAGGAPGTPPRIETVRRSALEQHQVLEEEPDAGQGRTLVGCGRPWAEQQAVIVDPVTQEPVPSTQVGEIWVKGPSVALGYWNRPEETAQTFGARLASTDDGPFLRTGDLGAFKDGALFVTGRLKDLIIIRGRNHYPQDLEATVERSHAALRPGCGAAFSVEADDQERLVVVQEVEPRVQVALDEAAAAIRQAVAEQHDVQVDTIVLIQPGSLPKTSSGKVQRHLVRARFLEGTLEVIGQSVAEQPSAQAAFVGPATAVEQRLADIWADVLGRERVGRHEHFLALGGDSLRATQVAARVRQAFHVELPVERLFESPTVAELADYLADHDEPSRAAGPFQPAPTTTPAAPEVPLPLSFAQQRLWFLAQLEPAGASYNVPAAVRLTGALDRAALEHAFTEIVRRHEVLRATFPLLDGQPAQVIAPAQPVHLSIVDLGHLPEAEREAAVQRLAKEEARRPFDLMNGPLLRAGLLRLGEREHVLLLTLHHIVADGWSMNVLAKELAALYAASGEGRPPALPSLSIQYADYARWQREWLGGSVREVQLAYWRRRLAGAPPVLELPTDRPRPAVQTSRGAQYAFVLPGALAERVAELSREQGVTLFMTLLAAFSVLLSRYTGQTDLCVGTPIANRTRVELEGLIGCFVNTLVLRTDLSGNPRVTELLARVREGVLGAQAHQDLPFEQLVEALEPVREVSHSPLFQVMLTLQAPAHLELQGLEARLLNLDPGTAKFDLSLDVTPEAEALACTLEYNADLFDEDTVRRMAGHVLALLQGITASPAARLSELPMLTEAERRLLVDWNQTSVVFPALGTEQPAHRTGACIHHLFEAQAQRIPEAVAVVWKEQALTYRELNERAGQLARCLRRQGVGPDVPVGLCLERSLDMMVAVLGVLKAGGTYVPLDPGYPKDRQAYMLADAKVSVLLTQSRLIEDLPRAPVPLICLDRDWPKIASSPVEAAEPTIVPDHLAYIIYTSGSTGRPKGVMVTHAALVNAFLAWERAYELGEGGTRHLQMANFAFDVFTGDWIRALCSGGRLVLCPSELLFLPEQLAAVIRREGVTHAEFVPAVVKPLAQHLETTTQRLDSLRVLVVGSDAWARRDYQALRGVCGAGTRIVNSYGVTEATIDSAYCEPASQEGPPDDQPLPIGFPIANTQLYIVDEFGQPVPTRVPGELCIAGAGLARGYWNRPDLTAEKFAPNPFGRTPGARLYRTGDRARSHPDGVIELLGRLDHQVKVRGFRIELGEIEALLREHPDVREAVVSAREDRPGEKRLAAYLVPSGRREPLPEELRRLLCARLPDYMVPSVFMVLPALPLTPNGKVDRRALPAPEAAAQPTAGYVAPRTRAEEVVADVWADVLGLERIGVHENFFDLGGHSLLLSKVWSALREALRCELSMMDLFRYPTVETLARHLARGHPEVDQAGSPDVQTDRRKVGQRRLRLLNERRQAASQHEAREHEAAQR